MPVEHNHLNTNGGQVTRRNQKKVINRGGRENIILQKILNPFIYVQGENMSSNEREKISIHGVPHAQKTISSTRNLRLRCHQPIYQPYQHSP